MSILSLRQMFLLLGMLCLYVICLGFCLSIALYFIMGALHSQDKPTETRNTRKFIVYDKKEDE